MRYTLSLWLHFLECKGCSESKVHKDVIQLFAYIQDIVTLFFCLITTRVEALVPGTNQCNSVGGAQRDERLGCYVRSVCMTLQHFPSMPLEPLFGPQGSVLCALLWSMIIASCVFPNEFALVCCPLFTENESHFLPLYLSNSPLRVFSTEIQDKCHNPVNMDFHRLTYHLPTHKKIT